MAFQLGVHDDKGQRRTMEDAYSFIVDFASVRGQGYFAVFDGHAGKYAAEWCGQHFHEVSASYIIVYVIFGGNYGTGCIAVGLLPTHPYSLRDPAQNGIHEMFMILVFCRST